ncbi:MAG: ABC transporter permease [Lachnospiraceae bacterium]|nr:ABC transporter permease [Lachnospiraceae bacterium]
MRRKKKVIRLSYTSMFIQNLKMVLRNIVANKKRNFFTCLGIIIGVAAVMGMSAGFDAMSNVAGDWFLRGGLDNTYVYWYDNTVRPNGLIEADIESMEALKTVKRIGPVTDLNETKSVYFDRREIKNVTVAGRSETLFTIDKASNIVYGRGFTKEELDKQARVCTISKQLAEKAFKSPADAVGRKITIGGLQYEIIGVDDISLNSLAFIVTNSKKLRVIMPYTTMHVTYGKAPLDFIVYSEGEGYENKKKTYNEIKDYLEKKFHIKDLKDFEAIFGGEELHQLEAEQAKQGREQSLIAGICMLVGGIGIMNMMFVSVTERTKEIGLRKALGATPQRIQMQFMFEAVILSLAGGIVGALIGIVISIIIGFGTAMMINMSDPTMEVKFNIAINYGVMMLGLLFSMVVGVVFGWMPARKASNLSPIDALKL